MSEQNVSVSARGRIFMADSTLRRVADNDLAKGDVLATARFAARDAVVSPASASPFRPEGAPLTAVVFSFEEGAIEVRVTLTGARGTPLSTAALSAVTVALLSVYDMCKAVDRSMSISELEILTA